jgi:hypothetical protein
MILVRAMVKEKAEKGDGQGMRIGDRERIGFLKNLS